MLKKIFRNTTKKTAIVSPMTGKVVPIEDVNDPTFAEKIMGEGIAIIPATDNIVAPCDAKVIMISETKHAIGLETADGMQMILHIGIDTVNRKGNGFDVVCELGEVTAGQPLVVFDRVLMESEGVDTTVLLIFVNTEGFIVEGINKAGEVTAGEHTVAQLVKKKV